MDGRTGSMNQGGIGRYWIGEHFMELYTFSVLFE